jgi:hypothetical protein
VRAADRSGKAESFSLIMKRSLPLIEHFLTFDGAQVRTN